MTRRGQAICSIDECDEIVAGRGLCNTHYANHRYRLLAYGRWKADKMPAEPVQERIRELAAAGIGSPRLSELTGIHFETLRKIAVERHWVRRRTWDAVMSIEPHRAWELAADNAKVDAAGTCRRLRALAAIGHRIESLNERLGLGPSGTSHLISGQHTRVTAARARAVADLFDTLWDQPGPCDRTRRMAARKGWVPPLAWDDELIDDPTASPSVAGSVQTTSVERITELRGLGVTDPARIAERIGLKPESVQRQIARMREAA